MLFSDKVLEFLQNLEIVQKMPKGVAALNPYKDPVAFKLCRQFYGKYYNDNHERVMIIGINPGRYGAGITGIPFTDPIKLKEICGIENDLPKKPELSADFIHLMIAAFGGTEMFFRKFYFTSVSPLGFTLDGLNLNYYDHPVLAKRIKPFIIDSIRTQLGFGVVRKKAYCLGEGANFKFLSTLNAEEKFFQEIIPLAHPRFIMQYRRKQLQKYVDDYILKLSG